LGGTSAALTWVAAQFSPDQLALLGSWSGFDDRFSKPDPDTGGQWAETVQVTPAGTPPWMHGSRASSAVSGR